MPDFSLQTVLEYRHSVVEGLEIELSVLLNKEQEIKEGIEQLNINKENILDEMKDVQKGNIDLNHLNQMKDNVKYLKVKIEEQHLALEELNKEIDAKRQELTEAKQEEEVLVKLKEKMMSDFEEKVKKAEDAAQDDIYIAQAFQRSKNSKSEAGNV